MSEISDFANGEPQRDDVTLVVMKVQEGCEIWKYEASCQYKPLVSSGEALTTNFLSGSERGAGVKLPHATRPGFDRLRALLRMF